MKTSTKANASLTVVLVLLSFLLSAQKKEQKGVKGQKNSNEAPQNSGARQQSQPHLNETLIEPGLFWSENFGSSVNSSTGDKGNQAVTFGWTRTDLSTNGAKPNQWYVSATAPGIDAAGACSQAWPLTAAANMTNRSLHIGKFGSAQEGDEGAFYQATEENITDVRIESPVINTTGMSDLEISFDYYTGGDGQANSLEFYCYDGEAWTLVTTFLPSDPGNCGVDDENTAQNPLTKWIRIQGLVLPESAADNSSLKIGFRWKNTANPSTSNVLPIAAAIDNIKIYNKGVVVNNNSNTSTERSAGNMITKNIQINASIENNKPIIAISTKNENKGGKYIIERSKDGIAFEKVSEISSTYNSKKMQQINYSFIDQNAPKGINYYRVVKQVRTNLKLISQTVVAEVSPERKINFTIYPNPNSGQFTVDFGGIENNFNVELILMDQYGNKVFNTEFELKSLYDNKLNVIPDNLLKNGRYYCTLVIEGIKYTSTVIVQ